MKKTLVIIFIYLNIFNLVNADYNGFINSPNKDDLVIIQDEKTRECEEIFLRAYMRREFTKQENNKCRNIFARKIEAEMQYKRIVLGNRGIY